MLDVEPERIDARPFERLIDQAQGVLGEDPSRARFLFNEALALWRGPPLREFEHSEQARREASRLDELHVLTLEGSAEARLVGGEHEEVIAHITGLVVADPLRERPRRLLMLALYRSGRHAEALAAYRDAHAALDEFGLQPGAELRALKQAILAHDEKLLPRSTLVAPSGQHNLPAPPTVLIGRAEDVRTVTKMLSRADARRQYATSQRARARPPASKQAASSADRCGPCGSHP